MHVFKRAIMFFHKIEGVWKCKLYFIHWTFVQGVHVILKTYENGRSLPLSYFLTFQPKRDVSCTSQKAECVRHFVHGAETGYIFGASPQDEIERGKKRIDISSS